ncbi:MAG: TIR domain-containing protein [Symploca sp. SIO3C6]|nr:TIR domain-containing protein [Symploca sp. SIO3C6]
MKNLFDAFISYGRTDSKAFATKLHRCLLEAGLKIWFDQNDIPLGVDFQNQIDDGIEKSHNFLFIIAPHSVNSPYCLKEIELAIKLKKRIIPLLHVEEISQEAWQGRFLQGTQQAWQEYKAQGKHTVFKNMHPMISKINWVHFREGIDDFEESLVRLIDLFGCHRHYVEQHTQFLIKATEWERNKKQTNYLLIGEERQQAQTWLKKYFKDEQPPCVPTDLHCEYITESIKNANNLMTEVLISYADEDRAMMEKIGNSLRREGITVWTNKTDIQTGENFSEAINRGIEQTDKLVYLLSPASVKSSYTQQELDLAVSLNKRIIPVLVRETDPKLIPKVLQKLQYIDLTDNVTKEDYRLDESQLLRIINQEQAYYNEHKILLTKALKWKQQNENPSILLRGYNLRSAETWLKVAKKRRQHSPTSLQEEFITQSLRQPPLESLDVFISYSRADSDLARKLNEELQLQGKNTWFDQESIASGSDFQQEVYQGIKVCDNFLFIISSRSVNSPYCADEVEYAANLNKRFVTVLHRQVNTTDLHPELAKVQWIDFNQHNRDFNANFHLLVRTLDTDREHVHSHTKWLQRSLEWQQQGKSVDLLLRGSEFLIAQNWLQTTEQEKKQPAATMLQKAFIEASKNAIAVAAEEEKRRQAEMLRLQEERTKEAEARLAQQKKSLVAVSMLLVAAVGVSLWAIHERKKAEFAHKGLINSISELSLVLSEKDQKFEALIGAINAGGQLQQKPHIKLVSPLGKQVLTALQAAVYGDGFRERNRLSGHTAWLSSVSFSPDGKMIASASGDKTVKLWSAEGKELSPLKGHSDAVMSVSFSPDGKNLATASWDRTVKLWSLEGKELLTLKGHSDAVMSVSFSPDGKTLASASGDKTVKLWSLKGKELLTLKGHKSIVLSVNFSPDGKTLATTSADKTVKLWSIEGKEILTLKGHTEGVNSVSFSPDGKTIATASGDKTVKLWSFEGKEILTLKGHTEGVNSVSFSPDGKMIATASKDKTIKLWSVEGKELSSLQEHSDEVSSISFSPNGKTIATASWDKTVKLWSSGGKELSNLNGHTAAVMSVSFSPDGKTIATASRDKTVKLWSSGGKELSNLNGHTDTVMSVSFSPDGKTIATASWDKTVKLWSFEGKEILTLKGHSDGVNSVSFSPDGKMIATASRDKTVKLWSFEGKELLTLKGHNARVNSVSFSPDGKMIATASSDNNVKLWSIEGKELSTLKSHNNAVNSVSFSPDGKMIATASRDKTVKLWSIEGKELSTLKGHTDEVRSVSFSPDGKMIATASGDETVKLWSAEGKELSPLKGHTDAVYSLSFSPDGKTLATASWDSTVFLWNLENLHPNKLKLQLNQLMQDACDWVGDYLKHNAPKSDRDLCDNIKTHIPHFNL